jgi:SNF2 family DNA or RNA helicase
VTPVLNLSSLYRTPIFTLRLDKPALKDSYGASYYGPAKEWRFPAFYPVHQIVISDLKKLVPTLTLSEEAQAHVTALSVPAKVPNEFSYVTTPYQHQVEGLEHLYQNYRAGLFYSPGLGKCKITIDLQRLTSDKMLVICPRIMLHTWIAEFKKHGNLCDVVILDGYSPQKKRKVIEAAVHNAPTVCLTTYGIASRYASEIVKIPYSCIVADESHQLKSRFSKRSQAVMSLGNRAYRRILLSGTPSLGSPFDMYGQLRFLGKYFCAEDWWKFRRLFGVFPKWEKDERVPKMLLGFKNLDLMNKRVNLVCIRKTKEECLDLPDQVIIDHEFGLSGAQKKVYNNLITDRCDAVGSSVRERIEENSLGHLDGVKLPPHVIVDEQISLLNKLDQLASGFVYKTVQNPRLCDGCPHIQECVKKGIRAYTTKCRITKVLPSVIERQSKNARLEACEGLMDIILKDEQNKVIIWANYTVELDDVEDLVKGLKLGYVRVQGGLTPDEVSASMSRFNTEPSCRVYIGQVSTGVGITLNAANYTIYYNLPWNLEHYQQSLDRNYRIGQNRKVTVYRLIARYTLDPSKAAALDQKMDFSTLVTMRSVCATCSEFSQRCAKYKIQVYDPECIYDRTMLRSIAEVRLIP